MSYEEISIVQIINKTISIFNIAYNYKLFEEDWNSQCDTIELSINDKQYGCVLSYQVEKIELDSKRLQKSTWDASILISSDELNKRIRLNIYPDESKITHQSYDSIIQLMSNEIEIKYNDFKATNFWMGELNMILNELNEKSNKNI